MTRAALPVTGRSTVHGAGSQNQFMRRHSRHRHVSISRTRASLRPLTAPSNRETWTLGKQSPPLFRLHRNIYFRDGKILRDVRIAHPQEADRELLRFAHAEAI